MWTNTAIRVQLELLLTAMMGPFKMLDCKLSPETKPSATNSKEFRAHRTDMSTVHSPLSNLNQLAAPSLSHSDTRISQPLETRLVTHMRSTWSANTSTSEQLTSPITTFWTNKTSQPLKRISRRRHPSLSGAMPISQAVSSSTHLSVEYESITSHFPTEAYFAQQPLSLAYLKLKTLHD